MNIVKKYYRHTLGYSRTRFIIENTFLGFILQLVVGLIIVVIATELFNVTTLPPGPNKDLYSNKISYSLFIILTVFIAPFFETSAQWIPIAILKKLSNNFVLIILFAAILFTTMHLSYGILYALTIFPSGLILSWSFYCKYKRSLLEAYFITFTIHSISNLISVLFIFIPVILGYQPQPTP